jgi:hypothetical protein
MKKTMMAVAAVALLGWGMAPHQPAMSPDEEAVRRAVQHYFDGSRNADSAEMGKAFETSVAHMLFIRDSALVDVPIPEFLRRIAANHTADFKPDQNERKVAMVDIAGNSAIARLETRTRDQLVVDYMSLLKIRGNWKIVTKIFDRVPLTARSSE